MNLHHHTLRGAAVAAVAALLVGTGSADAGRLDLDINAVPMRAIDAFGLDYSGRLLLGGRSFHPDLAEQTEVVSISVDGNERLAASRMATVEGYIDFQAGVVTHAFLKLFLLDERDDLPNPGLDAYFAVGVPNSGHIERAIDGGPYQIGGLTMRGTLEDGNGDGRFGGVDLSEFGLRPVDPGRGLDGELMGSFLVLDYEPDASGADVADIEFRAVPLPSAALLGAPLVLGLPVLRRKARS